MRIPLWLIAILFVGWSAFSVNYWYCNRWGHCGSGQSAAVAETTGEPLFRWNAADPEKDANFDEFKSALLKKGSVGDTLVITGFYRKGETAPKGLADLGLARAQALLAMMGPELPADRILVKSELVADSLREGGPAMPSARFDWRKLVMKKDATVITETKDKTGDTTTVTFLFPFNSAVRTKNAAIDEYLKKTVDQYRDQNVNFAITGHTDNIDDDKVNDALGLARAQSIARTLNQYGIKQDRVQVESKGKREPIADNETEEGRQKNRRAVLVITKSDAQPTN